MHHLLLQNAAVLCHGLSNLWKFKASKRMLQFSNKMFCYIKLYVPAGRTYINIQNMSVSGDTSKQFSVKKGISAHYILSHKPCFKVRLSNQILHRTCRSAA